jgi:hypothetical protein
MLGGRAAMLGFQFLAVIDGTFVRLSYRDSTAEKGRSYCACAPRHGTAVPGPPLVFTAVLGLKTDMVSNSYTDIFL